MTHRFRTMSPRNPTAAGYGYAHAQARKAAARRHNPTDPCSRCRKPLGPMGPNLHYDHNGTRTGYLGFAHARCNLRAGAREGNRRQRQQGEIAKRGDTGAVDGIRHAIGRDGTRGADLVRPTQQKRAQSRDW